MERREEAGFSQAGGLTGVAPRTYRDRYTRPCGPGGRLNAWSLSMNLFQLEDSLPNGLHDAKLRRVSIDYIERTAILELEIWVDDIDALLELYRPARITLSGLVSFVIEPPYHSYPFRDAGALTIDLSRPEKPFVAGCESESAFRLFISEFNSFIYADAPMAELEWLGEAARH